MSRHSSAESPAFAGMTSKTKATRKGDAQGKATGIKRRKAKSAKAER
jgi:hypothetical protein